MIKESQIEISLETPKIIGRPDCAPFLAISYSIHLHRSKRVLLKELLIIWQFKMIII